MKVKIDFTGSDIIEQRIGGPDEMLVAEVYFRATFADGQVFNGKSKIKQTVGSNYRDKIIEVSPPEGLPQDRPISYDQFSQAARKYYTEKIVHLES